MTNSKSAKKPASVNIKALTEADLAQVSGGMEGGGGDCGGSEGCGNDGGGYDGGGYEAGDYAGNERGCTLNDSQNGYRDCGGGAAG